MLLENKMNVSDSEFTFRVMEMLPSRNTTLHASVLLRTAVFSPVGRTANPLEMDTHDVSELLSQLEICKREGFDKVTIKGQTLNVETDFRVWCGCLKALSLYGATSEKIELGFIEFVKLCNYPAKRIDKKLRKTIDASFSRIASKVVELTRTLKDDESELRTVKTHLLTDIDVNEKTDTISFRASSKLWELYAIDHQILISRHVLDKLPRAETAQALYLYLASLPVDPHPISLERMRLRCQLKGEVKQQNLKIRKAIQKLEQIGYINGVWATSGANKGKYKVFSRDPKLTFSEAQTVALIGNASANSPVPVALIGK